MAAPMEKTRMIEDRSGGQIVLVGTIPPPITGQSVAFDMLVKGLRNRFALHVHDISGKAGRRDKSFTLLRAWEVVRSALGVFFHARKAKLLYLTIAQSRWGFLRDALIILLGRLAGAPVVIHLHGGNYDGYYRKETWLLRHVIRFVLNRVARFVVLSESLHDQFSFLGNSAAERVTVVPNGCPVELGSPRPAPRGRLHLLYLSNLLIQKGYLDIVDAMVHLRRLVDGIDLRLTIAGTPMLGEDDYKDVKAMTLSLRNHIRYNELEDVVEVLPSVRRVMKERLFIDSDVAVLPTYYVNEGQPLAVIEAMAHGLPVIATNWRSLAEMMVDGGNGLVVPPRSALAIARAAARFTDPDFYERVSRNAIETAQSFSVNAHVDRMADLFGSIAHAPGR
ncbi:MAG: glycosyltransferase family 4 protein [Magnetospirillum sp.]|nr:glycosyltransferase family 4 protein [Magnetospirillum sp.]